MADDLTKTGAADRSRINLNEDDEVDFWAGGRPPTDVERSRSIFHSRR
jgi:hypothetical protein